jgi:hypothetical protein
MIGRAHIPVLGAKADRYASLDEDSIGLCQLSFLLTGNPEKAQRCFAWGFEDCVTGNPVFREWAHSWAKRTIIQNAIKELKPRPMLCNSSLSETVFSDVDKLSRGRDGHFEIDVILGLEDFERFVFIMSVLERYSDHDCALLLGCSVQQFRQARTCAFRHIENSGGAAVTRELLLDGESDRESFVVEGAHENTR